MASDEPKYQIFDPSLPDYINFLLSPEISDELDLQVTVGPDGLHQERIGAIKWMLIARSKVLRVMLLKSKIKSPKEFSITDLEPATFRHFLTYSYGHDNVDKLQFEQAVKLLSAAEKYEVPDLKSRLADTITPQVTVANIPVVLDHGPVCETVPSLWAETTRVIQTETKHLLENPQFLNLKPEAVVHILQQDSLSVEEVELWRASLKWARHRLGSAGGPVNADLMRSTMLPLLKHTRLCTLSTAQMCHEVIPSKVLTYEEVQLICTSMKEGSKEAGLTTICNVIEPRKCPEKTIKIDTACLSPPMVYVEKLNNYSKYVMEAKKKVKLKSFEFMSGTSSGNCSYQDTITVKICRETDHIKYTSSESPRVIRFNELVPDGQTIEMPLRDDQGCVELEPNTKYVVRIEFENCRPTWIDHSNTSHLLVSNSDLTLTSVADGNGGVRNHFKGLRYTIV